MRRPVILYRDLDFKKPEFDAAANAGFRLLNSRIPIERGDLVVGRYSVLPFYHEQERDMKLAGATLINSHQQHEYVADMRNWVEDLKDLTPTTWYRLEDIKGEGPFVLKGKTNSKKFQWKTHMFARNRTHAVEVYCRLQEDTLIGSQDIYIRQYVPLMPVCESITGMPIGVEFRFFVCYGEVLCGGFYWSSHVGDIEVVPSIDMVPKDFLFDVTDRIGTKTNFYALDIAITADGKPIVIELNDGQMSGASENDLDLLYGRLYAVLTKGA